MHSGYQKIEYICPLTKARRQWKQNINYIFGYRSVQAAEGENKK